jgi:hypothetical protein
MAWNAVWEWTLIETFHRLGMRLSTLFVQLLRQESVHAVGKTK